MISSGHACHGGAASAEHLGLFTLNLSVALFSAINLTLVIDTITIVGRELTRFNLNVCQLQILWFILRHSRRTAKTGHQYYPN